MSISDKDGIIFLDGEYVPWREAKIHVLTHTLHYGCGVFEGIRAYQTPRGTAIFRLDKHVARLLDSAKILGMKHAFTTAELSQIICEVVRQNNLSEAYIRPMIYYGSEAMGLHAKNLRSHFTCAAWEWGSYLGEDKVKLGINVKTVSVRRLNVNGSFIKAKANGYYINSILALQEAKDSGADEALLLDQHGYVAEGSGENIFVIKNGVAYTPQLTNVLAGITRASMIQIFHDLDIPIFERNFTRDEIYIADESFFTGTAAEITPIRELDNRVVGCGKPGPITLRIQKSFFDAVKGLDPRYETWLTYL